MIHKEVEDFEYEHNDIDAKIEHQFTDNITCPYCGYEYEYKESREMPGNITNAWRFDVECRQCKKMFSASWDWDDEDGADEDDGERSVYFYTYYKDQSQFVSI